MIAPDHYVQILDIIHAASYIWKVTEALYPDNSTKENIPIVKKYMSYLLNGQVKKVIRSVRYLVATHRKIIGKRLDQIKTSSGYLENNAHRMHYNEYLTAGTLLDQVS